MSFKEKDINVFLANFNTYKNKIRKTNGCHFLELYKDKNKHQTFFTYSFWKSEKHLQAYRNSELFKEVWGKTKILFNKKPKAWSVTKLESLP